MIRILRRQNKHSEFRQPGLSELKQWYKHLMSDAEDGGIIPKFESVQCFLKVGEKNNLVIRFFGKKWQPTY